MLSRAQMEDVIRNGGSVLHGGRIITRAEHLPTEADLAAGNPEQERVAAAALEAQIAALQAQYDRLTQARAPQTGGGSVSAPQGGQLIHGAPSTQRPTANDQSLADIVGEGIAGRLAAAGYDSSEAIAAASDEQLRDIDGIGPGMLKRLRQAYGGGTT